MGDCADMQQAIDRLLDGAEAEPVLAAHLATCPACRAGLEAAWRQHRLLLEHGAAAEAAPRLLARMRMQAVRRPWWRSPILPWAVAAGLTVVVLGGLLARPGTGPVQVVPVAAVSPDAVRPWPWLDWRMTAGTTASAARDADGIHRVRLVDGRLRLATDERPADARLELRLGQLHAELLGTAVDAAWDAGRRTGYLRVHGGQVRLTDRNGDRMLNAGEEAHLCGEDVLPALPSLPGTVWIVGETPPVLPAPRLILADSFKLRQEGLRYEADAALPGGGSLVSTAGSPDASLPAQHRVQAEVALDLAPAVAGWDLQTLVLGGENERLGILVWLARTGGDDLDDEGRQDVRFQRPPRRVSLDGQRFWLPDFIGGRMRYGPIAGSVDLRLMAYRPRVRVAAVLVRPLAAVP
jgi:hypothetical protein